MTSWLPIETAPKDDTPIDLWCADRKERLPNYSRVEWEGQPYYQPNYYGPTVVRSATHWMPIPSAPRK